MTLSEVLRELLTKAQRRETVLEVELAIAQCQRYGAIRAPLSPAALAYVQTMSPDAMVDVYWADPQKG